MMLGMNPPSQPSNYFGPNHAQPVPPLFGAWGGSSHAVPSNLSSPYSLDASAGSQKRVRDDFTSSQQAPPPQNGPQQGFLEEMVPISGGCHDNYEAESSNRGKKKRSNEYRPPTKVPATFTSVLGSLVGGGANQTNSSVQMRRNLSGTQLDQFLGNEKDAMEDDTFDAPMRERSMSF
mmetsp:Transcript_24954/g.58126  ORF Transcript_24954/g.58126 Transcript_24954/m.58126 type:complete len:177 (+) Transcript_24954:135-665(+)